MDSMFREATSFNQDLSSWDIGSVTDMWDMFDDATSFNQNLCAWGDKFSYDSADDIFLKSGCTFQDTPREDTKGPFCASDCGGSSNNNDLTQASSEMVLVVVVSYHFVFGIIIFGLMLQMCFFLCTVPTDIILFPPLHILIQVKLSYYIHTN